MVKFNPLWLLLLCIVGLTSLSSCKKDEPVTLAVSPSNVTLLSDKNSSSTITISSNSSWTLSNSVDWIAVSANSGNGNTTVTLTALSQNASASSREANISISCGDKTENVSVSQLGAFTANCKVDFEDILLMTTSVAFKFDIERNVDYFNFGWLKSTAAGWTDEKIVEWLSSDESQKIGVTDDMDELYGLDEMRPGTEYFLVAVGFDDKGNRGELTKVKVKTPTLKTNEAVVEIDEVWVDETRWGWTTYPLAKVQRYYMFANDEPGFAQYIPYFYNEAMLASLIKDMIAEDLMEPYANSVQSWSRPRSQGSNALFVCTWGKDVDGEFANMLEYGVWSVSSSSKPRKQGVKHSQGEMEPKLKSMSVADYKILRNSVTSFTD